MEWISVKSQTPDIDQIVVAWMHKKKEPVCVRFTKDEHGPLWLELEEVDAWMSDREEDIISHWIPLPEPPKD